MGMREKLIEILRKPIFPHELVDPIEAVADYLLDNGVTIATDNKWIPVTERLPEDNILVLCIGARGGMFLGRNPSLFSDGTCYFAVPNARNCRYGTHWMPLPEPPKED